MGRSERIGLLVAAVVVLIVGAVVLGTGGGDEGDGEDRPAVTSAATQPQTSSTQPTETQATTPKPEPRVDRIRIRGGNPVGEVKTLKYDSGETVRIRFSADAASEIHIHGYDRYVNVPAGGSATARFEADAEGVFEIEDHGSGAQLAKLEVSP